MPRLSILMIRTGLIYLGTGFSIGALILYQKGVPSIPWAWRLLPLHQESLLFGWTVQLAFGVAYWILPRINIDGRSERGTPALAWSAYGLLNAGILGVALGAWPGAWVGLPVTGRLAELLAALCFARHAWSRVRAAGYGRAIDKTASSTAGNGTASKARNRRELDPKNWTGE